MDKRHGYLFLLISLFLVAGCETEPECLSESRIPVVFMLGNETNVFAGADTRFVADNLSRSFISDDGTVSVSLETESWPEDYLGATRTSWNTTGGTAVTWDQGDPVGVYMRFASGTSTRSNNVRYNVATGSFASSGLTPNSTVVYFPSRTHNMVFYGYYPYSSGNVTTNPIKSPADSLLLNYTLPADQSASATLKNCDIMCAVSSSANGASPNVTLPFNHKMVLMTFKVNTTILARTLTKVTLSGSAVSSSGTLNLRTATLAPNTSITFTPFVTTSQPTGLLTYAYVDVIINPCSIGTNLTGNEMSVSLDFTGVLDKKTALGSNITLVPGTRYVWTINVLI